MIKVSKKAIGPIVVTALLLVVAVISVVGFQGWFGNYQSGINTKIEQQSSTSFNTVIETVIGDTLYFKNGGNRNITINSVKVDGVDCMISSNYSSGMNSIVLGNNCTQNLTSSSPEIVVITNSGILSKKYYVKNIVNTNSISSPISCPSGYISVPGNLALGTSNFCVMKYEAKNVGGIATSQAALSPWVSITQTAARSICSNLGIGYHLITDPEWVTIARNAENNPSNWNSSVVGSGFMYSGHNDFLPINPLVADVNDTNGYYLTGNSAPSNQRRTLNISGNIIWDFAGNVWSWTNTTITELTGGNLGQSILSWYEWSSISNPLNYGPSNSAFNSVQGIGKVITGGQVGNTLFSFARGGNYYRGAKSGAFALLLNYGPLTSGGAAGFRCSFA